MKEPQKCLLNWDWESLYPLFYKDKLNAGNQKERNLQH